MADIQDIYQAVLILSFPFTLAVMGILILIIIGLHCHRHLTRRRLPLRRRETYGTGLV